MNPASFYMSLNERSIFIVEDLFNQLVRTNSYPNFKLELKKRDDGGSSSITLFDPKSNIPKLKYMFFPQGIKTNIHSISIYGIQLKEMYDTINQTKNIFGFKVTDISFETQNSIEPFVDIYIAPY